LYTWHVNGCKLKTIIPEGSAQSASFFNLPNRRGSFSTTLHSTREKQMKLWERVEYSAIIDRKPLRLPNNRNGR
jgi:hypothetical protein